MQVSAPEKQAETPRVAPPPQTTAPDNTASQFTRYAIAIASLAVFAGLRHLLEPYLQGRIPFMLFVPPAAIAAWYGGLGPGLLATLGGLLLGRYHFIPAQGSREGPAADLLLMLVYVLLTVTTVCLFEVLHRSRRRAQQQACRLREEMDRRQMAEQRLRDRETQLLAGARAARMGMWTEDLTTGRLWWSSELEEIAGLQRGTFDGSRQSFINMVHPEDRERIREVIEGAVRSNAEYEIEFRLVRPDGQVRWLIGRGRAFRDERDRPVRLTGIGMDVTERMQIRAQREELTRQLTQERERLRESLRQTAESERRYRSIGELIPYGFWMCDPAGHATYLSQSFLDLIGMSAQDALQKGWTERLEAAEAQRTLDDWKRCIAARGIWNYEHRIRGTDGQYRTVLSRGVPLLNAEGEVECWVGIHFDITDRKQAEDALQLNQFAMDHASDAVFWIDAQGRFLYVNEAACQVLGYTSAELTRMSVPDIDPEFPADSWAAHFEKLRETHTLRFETRHRAKSGRIFPVEIVGNYILFGDKEYVFSFARDITFRKLAEKAIRESEERYRRLVDLSPDAILVHSGMKILYANAACLQVLGAEWPEQVVGRPAFDFVHPDFRELAAARVKQMRETGQPAPLLEQKWLKLDGSTLEVEVAAVSLLWEGETAVQVLARDITERRRVEAELTSYRERLEELVMQRTEALRQSQEHLRRSERLASLGTLAAGIAHEINNPLNSIILTADYASQFPNEVEADKAFETIIKEAQRGGRIVKSVMKFARQDVSPKSPQNINEVVTRAAELARTYVHSTRLRLQLELTSDLPLVTMSPEEIEQVVINLVQNAVEAGQGEVRVRLATAPEPEGVRIEVEDNGPGISEENLQRIFDPFFSTRHGAGGTGLGLSICYAILAEHGGSIQVTSKLGEGSTFTVHLPINKPSQISAARQAAAAAAADTPTSS